MRVLAILGPTATGKTNLGVKIAHELGSEIISADSRQVYRGLDIGTGKDLEEYAAVDPPVTCHLIDVADPRDRYTVFDYQRDCFAILSAKAQQAPWVDGETPMVMVGGSGLYAEAVLRQYRLADVSEDPQLRATLEGRPQAELAEMLRRESPEIFEITDRSNRRRLVRALEIAAAARRGPVQHTVPPDVFLEYRVVVMRTDRGRLRERIQQRLAERLEEGMVNEVRGLVEDGVSPLRLNQLGLEYREVVSYLDGRKSYQDMVKDLATRIGQFAKRQDTWFRGMQRRGQPVTWIDPGDVDAVNRVIERW